MKEKKQKNKFIFKFFIALVVIALVFGVFEFITKHDEKNQMDSSVVSIVPTMKDEITLNSAWCATFQLVWNDLQDNLTDGKVKFEKQNTMVDNLNLQLFKEKNISEEYYYKNWGLMNLNLKTQIENGIKDKFNETSDVLNMFRWEENTQDKYFFYAMLRRKFEFPNEFQILENKKFNNTENVAYFGIDSKGEYKIRNQVRVLYYNNSKTFAVLLKTTNGDEVILARNTKGKNFEEIYENINKETEKYDGETSFSGKDMLSIPNLDIDLLKEYDEITGQYFKTKDNKAAVIDKAVQTIKMKLDNKGGSIKSEAAIAATTSSMGKFPQKTRNFDFNETFVIFLKENNKELPYFAAQINNIELFL